MDSSKRRKISDDSQNKIALLNSDITPLDFFYGFITKRSPAKFTNFINDSNWKVHTKWTNEYLCEKVGNCFVRVENRSSEIESFGRGNEVQMKVSELLSNIENMSSTYYMTTQELEYDAEDRPSIVSPPINHSELSRDYPLRPSLMGNLIPQNVNIWFGFAPINKPSSSRLHHDFHDNLYIVLRGIKRIRIFSVDEISNLYTVGNVARVHTNGRVNYEGQLTNADGSDCNAVSAYELSINVEEAARKLALAEETGEINDEEDELDRALERVLDTEVCSDNDDFIDDYDDEEEEEEEENNVENIYDKANTRTTPCNFSLVDSTLPREELDEKFPLYQKALVNSFEVVLYPGEMLYLPAGYFHEVYSSCAEGKESQGHLAFNYWFHPPDNSCFEKPYTSNFWSDDWKRRNLDE